MTIRRTVIWRGSAIALACAALLGCAGAGEEKAAGPPLSGNDIQQLISGNTITGAILAQEFQFYYQANGQVNGAINVVNDDNGTWEIEGGNTYCHQWTDFFGGVKRCYQWVPLAAGRYRMNNVDADRGEDLEVWKIEHGNPLGM